MKNRPTGFLLPRTILILFLINIISTEIIYASADTTYGNTREIPKPNETGSNQRGAPQNNPENQDNENLFRNDDPDIGCEKSPGCAVGYVLFYPVIKLIEFTVFKPTAYIVTGKKDLDPYSENRINQGINFGLGPNMVFNSSLGISFTSDYYLGFKTKNSIVYGFTVGASSSFNNIYQDYTRDVFVNGVKIGYETDKTSLHRYFCFPLLLQIKYLPNYFKALEYSIGVGATYLADYIDIERRYSYTDAILKDNNINSKKWAPTLMFRFGRKMYQNYIPNIQWNIFYNNRSKNISLPSENSLFTSQFFWEWGIKF